MLKKRHIPVRSCVVCRETSDKRELLRVVRLPEKEGGQAAADRTGKRAGRGAYVCADTACIDKAQKGKKFERSLSVTAEKLAPNLFDELRELAAAAREAAEPAIHSEAPMN